MYSKVTNKPYYIGIKCDIVIIWKVNEEKGGSL